MGEPVAESGPKTERETVWILDTSAVMSAAWAARAPTCITVPGVEAELTPGGRTYALWQRLLAAGLKIQKPGEKHVERVHERARRLGETRLSATDLELAALADEKSAHGHHGVVVTDDYALQNLLTELKLGWQAGRERGIQDVRVYRLRCAGCGRWYDPDADHRESGECPVCGSKLRRRRVQP